MPVCVGRPGIRPLATATIRSCWCASTMQRRTAGGSPRRSTGSSGCQPKRNGKRRRAAASKGRRYPWGDEVDSSHCNYLDDPLAKHQRGTRPTGTYPPNAFGLCDVVGNVWEWVSDWYDSEYYGSGEMNDPRGPDHGSLRIVRGGSWVNDDVSMLRCAYRHTVPPDTYAYSIGFRVVCMP